MENSVRIAQLRQKADELKQAKVRAELEVEAALLKAEQAKQGLAEFKISTVAEGETLLAKMDLALSQALTRIENELSEAEGL